jgi:hypothetical protein
MRLLPVFLLLATTATAEEYRPETQRWVVEMHACDVKTHQCGLFRRPVDAEGMLCEFAMMKSEVQWTLEHPDYHVDSYHCSKSDDIGL